MKATPPDTDCDSNDRRQQTNQQPVQTGLGPGTGADVPVGVAPADVYSGTGHGLVSEQSEQGGWRGSPVGNPSDRDAVDGAPAQTDEEAATEATPYRGGDATWPHGQWHDDERGGGGDWARSTRGNSYRKDP